MKSVNLKAIKHNLREELKDAVLKSDRERIAKAAQAIRDAGYELEDMGYTPTMFAVVASAIVESGWRP